MSFHLFNNKNNASKKMIEPTEYQQSLIKCDYILAVCDELLNQLQTDSLQKNFLKNKLIADSQPNQKLQKYDRIEFQHQELMKKNANQYQTKAKHLQSQIKQQQLVVKRLKNQIYDLKQSKHEGAKNTRLSIKRIKEASQLELQTMQLRKMLNCELKNLNSLQLSNIEINEGIESYDKKQAQLKNKINKLTERQNQYFQFRQLEQQYQSLIQSKRKIAQQNAQINTRKHSEIYKKIHAIGQANSNLAQMERYEKELALMIKQKQFIIQEIQSREEVSKSNYKASISDDENQIFEKEVQNLRKTIVNRNFHKKHKSIMGSDKLQTFLNTPTPKTTIEQSKVHQKKPNKKYTRFESIFKIQIDPVSHFQQKSFTNKQSLVQQHRHSLAAQINKQPVVKDSSKKQKSQDKPLLSQNQIPDLDTMEITTLQNIIKKKEQQINQFQQKIKFIQNSDKIPPQNPKKLNQLTRSTNLTKKLVYTEPVQPKRQSSETNELNNREGGPNSRFIEQIIESTNDQNLQNLKNNIRFRTKKSQTQKYRNLQALQKINQSQRKKLLLSVQQSKQSSSKTIKCSLDQKKLVPPKSMLINNKNSRTQMSFDLNQDNQLMGVDIKKQNQSDLKSNKPKYKNKLEALSQDRNLIDNVIERINLLKKPKKQKQEVKLNQRGGRQQGYQEKQQIKDKVKIFKLSSKRKYGNTLTFDRKGKAEVIQDFESEQEMDLPKIQEEDESIQNTLQSIAYQQKQLQKQKQLKVSQGK